MVEKIGTDLTEKDFSTAERRKGLLDKLEDICNRHDRKVFLMAALLLSTSGTGTNQMMEQWGSADRQQAAIIMDMDSLAGQETYERRNHVDSHLADRLRQEIGLQEVADIEALVSVTNKEERARYITEHSSKAPEVSGFKILSEQYNGPSDQEMREVIEALPLTYQIDAPPVSYDDEEMPMPDNYGMKQKGTAKPELEAAHASADSNEIVFSAGSRGTFRFDLQAVIHEEAHLKDWRTNKALTLPERMELVQEVIDRVNARDRFKSGYVESINNADKQQELRIKADEYYAEITAAYFDQDGFLLPEKDKQIVERVIHETDPVFTRKDRNKVLRKINALYLRYSEDQKMKVNQKMIEAGFPEGVSQPGVTMDKPVIDPDTGESIYPPHISN